MEQKQFDELSNQVERITYALDTAYGAINVANQTGLLAAHQLNTLVNQLYALGDQVTRRRRSVQTMLESADAALATDPALTALVERLSGQIPPRAHRTTAQLVALVGEADFHKLISIGRLIAWEPDVWWWRPPAPTPPEPAA